jgi:hypothetical protein
MSTCGWDVPLDAARLVGAWKKFFCAIDKAGDNQLDASKGAATAKQGTWMMLTCGGHGID